MIRAIRKGKHLILLAGLGLGLLVLLACTSGNSTPIPTAQSQQSQSAPGTDLSQLLAAVNRLGESSALGQQISRSQSVGTTSSNNAGIWVTGRGEATSAPDLAILNLGIEALADTVSEARDQAAAAMQGTVAALRAIGIAERDIQTRFFNISPRYTTREVTRELTREVIRERVIVGYQVNNQLTVKVRDLDSVGEIIDQVTVAGGDLTRFQGISFTIEDNQSLQDKARAAAIEDLLAKSSQIANLTGVGLGQLVFITESGGPVQAQFESERAFAVSTLAAPTPIMAGELTVVVTIQAVFEIQASGS